MRLIFLGTSGYHPTDRRQTACLFLPECGVVLDAGTGIFRLGRYGQTSEVDIFLTHAHLDHSVGLTYLFGVLKEPPLRRVTIHGEASKLQGIRQHLFSEPLFPVTPPWEFRPLDIASENVPHDSFSSSSNRSFEDEYRKAFRFTPEPKECSSQFPPNEKSLGKPSNSSPFRSSVALADGKGQLSFFPLKHPGGTLGFRLEWPGHRMAYVTDTTATLDAPYLEEIRGVDLLVHECYYPDTEVELALKFGHSSLSAVAEVARATDVGNLVLTHIDPRHTSGDHLDLSASRRIFPNISLAEDFSEVSF